MEWLTSTMLANATVEEILPSRVPSSLSDAALGGIIAGAVVALILFLAVTIATVYFFHRQRMVNIESPEVADSTFTYVKQVNLKDPNWTLPPGSTLTETATLPVNFPLKTGHVEHHVSTTTDRLLLPEISCYDSDKEASFSPPEVVVSCSAEAEVVAEKQIPIGRSRSTSEVAKLDEPEPVSETGSTIQLEPEEVSATDSRVELEPKAVSGTGSRDEPEPRAVPETGSGRDTQSVNSLNSSLSEDYYNRVIDEAFGAIDNFAYSDQQSDSE